MPLINECCVMPDPLKAHLLEERLLRPDGGLWQTSDKSNQETILPSERRKI